MQPLTSILRLCSWLVLAVAILLCVAASLWYMSGGRLLLVQSSSMQPQLSPRDVVLLRPTPPDQVKPGQVISFYSPNKGGQIISHRVIAVQKSGSFVTKGDNRPDQDLPVPASKLIGRVMAVAPGLGTIIRWFKSGYGLTIIYVILSCLLSINVGRFLALSGQGYELHSR